MFGNLRIQGWITNANGANAPDNYTAAPTTGKLYSVSAFPTFVYALQVKGVGGTPTSWTVLLEGSLDGANFDTLLTHINTNNPDGKIAWSMPNTFQGALFLRTRCTALALGAATSINASFLAA